MNLAFGWWAVTALGDYAYLKSGHLVLAEAQLLIEFPPGVTILLPPQPSLTPTRLLIRPKPAFRLRTTHQEHSFPTSTMALGPTPSLRNKTPEGYTSMMEENTRRRKDGLRPLGCR